MNLIIQLISGTVGGIAAGKAVPKFDLGTAGNAIAGLVGGGIGGQILTAVIGASAAGGTGMDLTSIVSNVAGGGIGGTIVLAIISVIKTNLLNKKA